LFGASGSVYPRESAAASREDERVPRHVELRLITEERGPEPLETVLGELLARLQVTVRLTRLSSMEPRQILTEHPGDPEAVARVWIDLRDSGRVTVYLAGNREDRVLVRHVPVAGHLDEVGREEIAHIVEASVDALLVGGRIGVATDEPRKAEPPAPRPPEHALNVGVGYEGHAWSTARDLLHGPAVSIGWMPPARVVRPLLLASGSLRFPVTVEGDPISTRLDQQTVRLLLGASWAVGKRWQLQAAVGGGLDWVRSSPVTSASTRGLPEPASTAVMPMGRAMFAAHFALTARADVFCMVGADVAATNVRYIVSRPNQDDVLFQPWRVRPFVTLGVSADVLPQ